MAQKSKIRGERIGPPVRERKTPAQLSALIGIPLMEYVDQLPGKNRTEKIKRIIVEHRASKHVRQRMDQHDRILSQLRDRLNDVTSILNKLFENVSQIETRLASGQFAVVTAPRQPGAPVSAAASAADKKRDVGMGGEVAEEEMEFLMGL
ncbi:MAG: hypothetical protein ACFFCQ_12660 [Promethearchaeota archaeon]